MTNELILTLDFERSPSARDIGEILSALGRDYREMTKGRNLVVVRVESGSIIATLTDAAIAAVPYVAAGLAGTVAVATAANTLAEFAANLKKWFGYAKSHKEKGRLYRRGRKSPGQRSVETIIKIAANTGSRVRVNHKSENGETLEVELTPAEALSAYEALPSEVPKKVRSDDPQRSRIALSEVQQSIERLQQMDTRQLTPSEIKATVEAIIAVLQMAGASHLLPEIASELERRGLFVIASAVREHIRPSGGAHEPPLGST